MSAVARVEKRLTALENTISRIDARHEIEELKACVAELQNRIAQLEAEIKSDPT